MAGLARKIITDNAAPLGAIYVFPRRGARLETDMPGPECREPFLKSPCFNAPRNRNFAGHPARRWEMAVGEFARTPSGLFFLTPEVGRQKTLDTKAGAFRSFPPSIGAPRLMPAPFAAQNRALFDHGPFFEYGPRIAKTWVQPTLAPRGSVATRSQWPQPDPVGLQAAGVFFFFPCNGSSPGSKATRLKELDPGRDFPIPSVAWRVENLFFLFRLGARGEEGFFCPTRRPTAEAATRRASTRPP